MNLKNRISIFIIIFFVSIPLLSLADDYIEVPQNVFDLGIPVSSNLSNEPAVNAKYAVVMDRSSLEILFGKNENKKSKMASTTKIMTAIIIIENCKNLDEVVTVSKCAARNWWI